jgi:hypothetical protein
MTKQSLLLTALKQGRTVTHATALVTFRIPNLSAVIGDLRRAGHKIKAVKVHDDGNGQPYTKWVYVK